MIRTITFVVFFSLTTLSVNAQYLHYDPIPVVPEPEVPTYTPTPPPSPPRYLPAPSDHHPNYTIKSQFVILHALLNGKDYSQHYINDKSFIAIYTKDDEASPYMAVMNSTDKTNSNGQMLAITSIETPQTDTSNGKTVITFGWEFKNSYDGTGGSATVTLTKEYTRDGTIFRCLIEVSNGTVCDFAGKQFQ